MSSIANAQDRLSISCHKIVPAREPHPPHMALGGPNHRRVDLILPWLRPLLPHYFGESATPPPGVKLPYSCPTPRVAKWVHQVFIESPPAEFIALGTVRTQSIP